jgi:hypothetical protein
VNPMTYDESGTQFGNEHLVETVPRLPCPWSYLLHSGREDVFGSRPLQVGEPEKGTCMEVVEGRMANFPKTFHFLPLLCYLHLPLVQACYKWARQLGWSGCAVGKFEGWHQVQNLCLCLNRLDDLLSVLYK